MPCVPSWCPARVPPVGGAGVQRVLKLAKYLPEHGVTPTVLTVENASAPLRDETLGAELSPDLEVLRARTLEPGYAAKELAWRAVASKGWSARRALVRVAKSLLVPDPQVLWLPAAAAVLTRRLLTHRDDVVFISGPPFSQLALGPLARRLGAAVVLDYRDEWTTLRGVYEMAAASARIGAVLEPLFLRSAHAVTTATPAFRSELCARFPFLDAAAVHTIENGFDPADFPEELPAPPSDRLVVTYVGTVFRLTRARGLLEAVKKLHVLRPDLAPLLELRFVGRIVETEMKEFDAVPGLLRLGYVDHARAVRELAQSHVALCLLDDVPGADRVYPAKIFEIMHMRRPCLALCPPGVLADLVNEHRLGEVVAPRDVDAIAAALARRLEALRAGTLQLSTEPVGTDHYNRKRQAAAFVSVFREALCARDALRDICRANAAPRTRRAQ